MFVGQCVCNGADILLFSDPHIICDWTPYYTCNFYMTYYGICLLKY